MNMTTNNKKLQYHYFYKITNRLNGHYYYGIHSTYNLNDNYAGSGTMLHMAYKKYGIENFDKEIIKFFDNREDLSNYEKEIVTLQLVNDINCYNIRLGGDDGCTLGTVPVIDEDGNSFRCSREDPKYISGEYKFNLTGRTRVKNSDGKVLTVPIDDPKYVSGEYHSISKGLVLVVDIQGNIKKIPVAEFYDNPTAYTSFYKDKALAKNVSTGNICMIDIHDEHYTNGEYVPLWLGKHHSIETKEKLKQYWQTHKRDGSKNSQYGTCWINNGEEDKKIRKDLLDDYISNGWIKGRTSQRNNIKNHESFKLMVQCIEEGLLENYLGVEVDPDRLVKISSCKKHICPVCGKQYMTYISSTLRLKNWSACSYECVKKLVALKSSLTKYQKYHSNK